MKYKKIVEGNFNHRPNRFIAHVLIHGKEEVVHIKNTGRCRELLIPGARVILEDCSHNISRKTKYSLIAVYKGELLVNMDSQVPNSVVYEALENNKIELFRDLTFIKREKTYGNSRFDIYYEKGLKKGFVEVKGVTLELDGQALFPDAPTIRGAKHVMEMVEAVNEGYEGSIIFLIQMKGISSFRPNWEMDENFSNAIKYASVNGVNVLAYDSIILEDEIKIGSPIPVFL